MSTIIITLNGEERDLPAGTVVADLLRDGNRGVAVAVNGGVVPRAEHPTTVLAPGDRVEVVTAVQGG